MNQRERLEQLLGGEALARLRGVLRRRFALGRGTAALKLTNLSEAERDALSSLAGLRYRRASSLSVSLDVLDEALQRAGLATSLRHALELLDGVIPDHAERRQAEQSAWTAALSDHHDHPHTAAFLARSEGRALLRRLASRDAGRAGQLLQQVRVVLERLPVHGLPRSQLAAETLGDAHALDRGRPIAALVLSILRVPEDTRDRDTWARVGVLVNELAKPVLVLNLPAEDGTSAGRLAERARSFGEPIHLSLRALLRAPTSWRVRDRTVFVCENANFIAMAADRLGARCAPLVCTDGMPSASQRTLLGQLVAAGAHLKYHGDYDWSGVAIGNYVIRTFDAEPWRFDAASYTPAGGRPLTGRQVEAVWDARLAPKMAAAAMVMEEELVAAALLEDLDAT